MNVVLLEPHGDDCALFAAFLACQYQPLVVTVLRPPDAAVRADETGWAMRHLGCQHIEWGWDEQRPDWRAFRVGVIALAKKYDLVIAPAVEEDGHDHHNRVGMVAVDVFPRVIAYTTYTRSGGRTLGEPVVPEPDWIVRKLRALACYESQISRPETRPWFMGPLDEYTAPDGSGIL